MVSSSCALAPQLSLSQQWDRGENAKSKSKKTPESGQRQFNKWGKKKKKSDQVDCDQVTIRFNSPAPSGRSMPSQSLGKST